MKDDVKKDIQLDRLGNDGCFSEGYYLLWVEFGLGFFLFCDLYFLLRQVGILEILDVGLFVMGVGVWMIVYLVIILCCWMRLIQ